MVSAYYTQKPQSQNHQAWKAVNTCFIWGCLFANVSVSFNDFEEKGSILFIDYKTLLAPASPTLLVAVN